MIRNLIGLLLSRLDGPRHHRQRGFLAAAAVGGALLSSSAAKSAASTQASAADRATATQQQMFNTQNTQQAPWRQAGQNALFAIGTGTGAPPPQSSYSGLPAAQIDTLIASLKSQQSATGAPIFAEEIAKAEQEKAYQAYQANTAANPGSGVNPGQFTHQFDANDLKTHLAPNYDFQLQQGLGATKNAANMQTGLLSGNTLKGINDYAQNFAGNAYQQAFNNYNTNQSNIFNRLSTVAGYGSGANQQSTALAGSLAPGIAQTQVGAGTAQASGTVGMANALSGGLNNAAGWYTLNNLNTPASSGGGGGGGSAWISGQPGTSGFEE